MSGVFCLPMMNLSAMKDVFRGQPAAILGGGPSLPDDMKKLPGDCILIAVNHHAFHHCKPMFVVYNDDPEGELLDIVQSQKAFRVSSHKTSDFAFDVDIWTGFYSSNTATWFALWLGCNPVILCGMDCYQGPVKYCHAYEHDIPPFHYPLDDHLRPWREDAKNLCPHPERIRVMSGPLTGIFEKYVAPISPLA